MNTNTPDTVDQLIKAIIKLEGGFVDNPHDHGGATKYGITIPTLEAFNRHSQTTLDVENITPQLAYNIYYQLFYFAPKINLLPAKIQDVMLQMAIHISPVSAIELLQDVLKAHGENITKIDGIIGPVTLKAASAAWDAIGNDLITSIVHRQIAYYQKIVQRDPSQHMFLSGWINRAESFLPNNTAHA